MEKNWMTQIREGVWLVKASFVVTAPSEGLACQKVCDTLLVGAPHEIEAVNYEAVIKGRTLAQHIWAEHKEKLKRVRK